MKNTLAAIVLIGFSFAFGVKPAAQTKSLQRMQAVAGPTGRTDLNSTLLDLDRASQAMQNDIANLHVEKWKSGWKTGFLKDGSHKEQAQHAAGSLQRNLSAALPGLIHDVQSSRGSISASFKLYDDVTLLCETLDSLITASERAGKKTDAAPLENDYSALAHIRRSLAAYIQQSAATWETRKLGDNEGALAYFQACKALSEYRQRRFDGAVAWAEKSLESTEALAKAKSCAVLAMAQWQLGKKDAARAALAQGNDLAPGLSTRGGAADLGDPWVAWLFARIALDEAAALLGPSVATDVNSSLR